MKPFLLILILAIALLTACGPKLERTLNAVFDTAPIAVDELQNEGAITAELAGQLRVDIPDGKKVTNDLIADLKRIPGNAPDRRAQQLAAWQKAEVNWLAIVNRGHFALNPKLQQFAQRANSLFAAGVAIYGGISAQSNPPAVPPNLTEKQMERMLNERLQEMLNSLK